MTSPAPALTVRPIRYTARADAVTQRLLALGLRLDVDHGAWRVLSAGRGRVAVHAVPDDDPLAGTTVFGLELTGATGPADLDALAARLTADGVDARRFQADHGPSLRVRTAGQEFLVDLPTSATAAAVPDPDLAVLVLLYTPDAPALAGSLAALGLRRRIEADSQTWFDLAAHGGGLVGVHAEHTAEVAGHPTTELHFEHPGELAPVADRLAGHAVAAVLVDESWGHSLRVPDPDGGEFSVNAAQTDLYGYRTVDADA